MDHVVILGGGIAGTTAAETLRKADANVTITIIEQEHHPLYSRVLLPHYVKGKIPREKVFLKSWEWYAKENIEIVPGVRVEAIDIPNRFVRTSEGRELPFDALLLAQGSELTVIGGEPRGVSYLHGIDDADHLNDLLRDVAMRPAEERRGVVIGGGFIALEYINIFAHFNIACSVLLRGNGFWSSILSPHSQKVLAQKAAAGGVTMYTHESAPEIIGEKTVEGVRLASGDVLPCAIVGVGIGMHPDRAFYAACNVPMERGIVVNEYLETTHSGVFAAGDGAEFFDIHVGRQVAYGNWMNAQTQGRVVAKTIAGERTKFDLVSSYTTNLLGLQMVFIGDVDRKAADEVRQSVAADDASVEEFYRAGKCVGAVLIGDISRRAEITATIKNSG